MERKNERSRKLDIQILSVFFFVIKADKYFSAIYTLVIVKSK
jgi:hypothetical protein